MFKSFGERKRFYEELHLKGALSLGHRDEGDGKVLQAQETV